MLLLKRELLSEAKLRELRRLFQIIKNSLSHFSAKNDSPLKDGAEAQLNSIAADNNPISANIHGGSKPPPYTVKVNLILNTATTVLHKSNKRFNFE